MKSLIPIAILFTSISLAPGPVFSSSSSSSGEVFIAKLRGDAEVPPVDTDTKGRFKMRFNESAKTIEFRMKVDNGERITQAHIHCAPEGANGPVVAFLAGFHGLGWDVDGRWIRNTTITNDNIIQSTPSQTCPETIITLSDLVEAIRNGNAYINVHSVANPTGEVRGQLKKK